MSALLEGLLPLKPVGKSPDVHTNLVNLSQLWPDQDLRVYVLAVEMSHILSGKSITAPEFLGAGIAAVVVSRQPLEESEETGVACLSDEGAYRYADILGIAEQCCPREVYNDVERMYQELHFPQM